MGVNNAYIFCLFNLEIKLYLVVDRLLTQF